MTGKYKFECIFENNGFSINVDIDQEPTNVDGSWLPLITTIKVPDDTDVNIKKDPEIDSLFAVLRSIFEKSQEEVKPGLGKLADQDGKFWILVKLAPTCINFRDCCSFDGSIKVEWKYIDAF